ncbi:hypothetical protein [Pseudoxanthomonas sacheonensis]|uniref:hypothetical protein n=1 Tax=Pseudoxanthomonas sacheonensis TaxID=443615 RepID=UPI0013D78A3E|nr:hypothetical protein [Pseudoxanthomonas sacheonensis]KAF1708663.1 hypothetical protein CSC73_08185 [Pseudoxanthomonas sacheonensis]
MKSAKILLPCLVAGLVFPTPVFALSVIVQYQGAIDNREAYFADMRSFANQAPADMGGTGTQVRALPVTVVYENANKPEFVHMELFFKCPERFTLDQEKRITSEDKNAIGTGDAVTFRIGPGSYMLRRTDLKAEDVPQSDWKTSNAPMLSKAGTLACNHIEIDQAMRAAIKDDSFDFDGFGKRIAKLGLPADMAVIGEHLPSEYMDFAWETFWWDKVLAKKRPDPTGKWAQSLSKADGHAVMEAVKKEQQGPDAGTASIQASLLDSIKKRRADTTADLQVAQNAGKHPDGSKMNKREKRLMAVFGGRPEQEVVATMGNPDDFYQGAGSRFLRYSAWWEEQGVTVYGAYGVIGGESGGYAECYAEFNTRQDAYGEWRVHDIVVQGDYDGTGSREIRLVCDDATRPKR